MIDHVLSNKTYARLEKRITAAQEKLKKKDPDSPLLKMVRIDPIGMIYHHFEGEEGEKYLGLKIEVALNNYATDLEQAVKNFK